MSKVIHHPRARIQALMLAVPLVAFIGVTFVAPLFSMMSRSLHDPIVAEILPRTLTALQAWDREAGLPPEATHALLAEELLAARSNRTLGRLATRLNRQLSGARSIINRTGRQLVRAAKSSSSHPGINVKPSAKPGSKANPSGINAETSGNPSNNANNSASNIPGANAQSSFNASDTGLAWSEELPKMHKAWGEMAIWETIVLTGGRFTSTYYLNAIDMERQLDGSIVPRPEDKQIYVALFQRTLIVSIAVTLLCLAIGYPLAGFIATSPPARRNLLLILVLLPFWTSLLVRTTSWIVLLQQQGVLNDLLVWLGWVPDDQRLTLIYNMTGTLVAMTHVLLPFMVLPLYSIMSAIPPVQMQAAASLGASWPQAFLRVYLPQSLPGISAGCLLVFMLAIGYYITPALVGGQSGQLVSNLIAFHIQSSLNWGLGAALGTILFGAVLLLFLVYDRVLGLDRLRLGS